MSRQAEMMRGPVAAIIDDVVEAVDRRFKAAYERAHVAAKQRALAAVPKATEMVIKKRRAAVEPTTPRPIKKTGKKDRAYVEDRLAQLLAGQDELRRGQVAVAQHVTRERVATAKAMEAVRKHEAEPPEIFLSHVVLTAEQIDLPVDELEPIPDEYDGDIQVYIRDSIVNKVIVGGPYPLRVPRGGWCREALKRAIKCTMDIVFPAVTFLAGCLSVMGLAPTTASSTARSAQSLTESAVSYIFPVPSAQDARKGHRIQEILKIGDPDLKYGGSMTIISQDGGKVLRGTADNTAAYTREMAAMAGDSVRMA